jgi:hypothetical protein
MLIGGGFLIAVLNILSVGILSGPLFGGYFLLIILMLRDRRKPEFNDLFVGFARLGQLFPFFFLSILIIIGFIFLVIPGIIMMTWWLYVLLLMADKELPLGAAMAASRRKVIEKGFFMHLVFAFMITIVPALLINAVAAVLPPLKLLQVLLIPFQSACLASLYLEQFGGETNLPPPLPPEKNGA